MKKLEDAILFLIQMWVLIFLLGMTLIGGWVAITIVTDAIFGSG